MYDFIETGQGSVGQGGVMALYRSIKRRRREVEVVGQEQIYDYLENCLGSVV